MAAHLWWSLSGSDGIVTGNAVGGSSRRPHEKLLPAPGLCRKTQKSCFGCRYA